MKNLSIAISLSLLLVGCNTTTNDPNTFTSQCSYSELEGDKPLTFTVTSVNEATLEGVICSGSLDAFDDMRTQFPSVATFNIQSIPGSADDEINLLLSAEIHQNGIATHLVNSAMIASGGTDLFLAGTQRTADDARPKIGVHSWSDSSGQSGKDLPRNHEEHQPYLDYYQEININPDFYWYTLDAAPANDIHWMTREEIEQYNVLTTSLIQ
ncbi:alpha/beta hydrolase [Photobacterium sanguinicancri]|uniref:alpha/beta hydrolase n=1 Tax=Photobacterium sanguinicancri TaxID=875932 RepID=UPI0024802BFF|nr:alpha/beta hydrolase [Photobacterium sanguinicancri]